MSEHTHQGKLIIFTAPSGAGKTTIVRHLLATIPDLSFSVSATSRSKRHYELEGRDYYFVTARKFRQLVKKDAFLEWEEVYPDQFYGTLKSEIDRLWAQGKHIVFDIDVQGALNIKKAYPDRSLSIFVKPPSLEILFERLRSRGTESEESLQKRISKATLEMQYEHLFDSVLVNEVLADTLVTAEKLVKEFIES